MLRKNNRQTQRTTVELAVDRLAAPCAADLQSPDQFSVPPAPRHSGSVVPLRFPFSLSTNSNTSRQEETENRFLGDVTTFELDPIRD